MLAALFFAAGCERTDSSLLTAETDEPGYRRAKDLLRQGRNQEALVEFNKVIEKRARAGSPESHLELGLLYQQHIKDPIAAIYHFKKFREVAPNSPKADLVRMRIDAATREFARTLPATPLENNIERLDMSEVLQRVQRENDQLKAELLIARTGLAEAQQNAASSPVSPSPGAGSLVTAADAPQENNTVVSRPPLEPRGPTGTTLFQPNSTPQTTPPPQMRPPAPTPQTQASSQTTSTVGPHRKHNVVKGDSLYGLALKYYGNRSRWRDILAANRDVLANADQPLAVGMVLKIPQ